MSSVTNPAVTLRPWVILMAGVIGCQADGAPTETLVESPSEAAAAPPPFVVHRIVFTSEALLGGAGQWGLYTIREDGTALTLLHQGGWLTNASWSPAGPHRIAFVEHFGASESRPAVIKPDGTGLQYLAPASTALIDGLTWAPDGTRLAYRQQGYQRLNVVNADGSALTTIASDADASPPAWHPDGQLIAYFRRHDSPRTPANDRGIWTVKHDGTGRTKIFDIPATEPYYEKVRLSYSPDGTKLAFCGEGGAGVSHEYRPLEMIDPDGSGHVILYRRYCVDPDWYLPEAMWSPDGSRILARTPFNESSWDLVTLAPDGSAATRLTTDGSTRIAAWSRQGTRIAHVKQVGGGGVLRVMSASGANKKQLDAAVFTWPLYGGVMWGP